MAKDLVRTRANIERFHEMTAQISVIGLRLQTLKSSTDMANSMATASKLMAACNKKMNLKTMQAILYDFDKNMEIMDMKTELINDAVDDAVEIDNEEAETDNVVSQILDEIGLTVSESVNLQLLFSYYLLLLGRRHYAKGAKDDSCCQWQFNA